MLDTQTKIKGVIFDLDGTLMHANLDFSYLRSVTGCPSGQDILEYISELSPQDQHSANKAIIEHELADATAASWIEGAKDFVEFLTKKDIPVAIVTRNCRQAAELKLSNEKALIDILITREDAPPKPDPTALLYIASMWGLSVEEVIYVGDYLYDIQAAKNAGMRAFLYAPETSPDYAHQADVIFDHYDNMGAHFPDMLAGQFC